MDKFDMPNRKTREYNNKNVSRDNLHSQCLGASGSRQCGYYYSATTRYSDKSKTTGRFLGNGQYVED